MANVQIPNLTAAISLNGTEQLEAVQSGSSVRVTTAQIATYTQATYPVTGITSIATAAPISGGTITTSGTISLQTAGVTNTYLASMAAGTVKANVTGNPASPTDATPSAILNIIGSSTGAMLYRSASEWLQLAVGSTDQILTVSGGIPAWVTTIPSSSIPATGVTAGTYGSATQVAQFNVLASGQISVASNVAIAIPSSQVTGLGTMAIQNASSVTITGGTVAGVAINSSTIGLGTPSTGAFTTLTANTISGLTSALSVPQGGTGFTSYTTGDLLYANSASSLNRLNDVATGNALISGGVGVAPSWGKVDLTTHVTGTLPVANGGTGATTLTGYLVGNGTSAFTAVATIPNAGLTNSSVTIGSTSIALGASSLTLAGLTTVTVTQDPTTSLQLATKQYVDNTVATVANTTYHASVTSATTAALTATYSNGTGGVGATLTNAGAQAAFSIDAYSPTATSRVLIKDQASAFQNGIYTVTTVGTGSTNWVLTRSTDFNTTGTGPNFIETGAAVFINDGTLNGSTSWLMNTTGTITVGTTSLNWTQISSAGNIQVDAPLIKTGNTLSLGTVTVANGGTGLTTYTAYSLLYAPTTTSVGNIAPGTVNYPLVSTGASSAPAYQQLSLTAGVTGILPVANGGTGTNSAFTLGSVVFAGASGNYVQDNAQFFYDDTNNFLGLGTASPNTRLTIVSPTQTTVPGSLPAGTDIFIVGADGALARITQDAYGTGFYPAYTGRAARGTAASPTASQTDDDLSQFTGRGYGASVFGSVSTGILAFHAAENFTNTAQGTYLSIRLAAIGATSPTERWRFGPAGQLGIGGATYGTSGYVLTSGGASAAPAWSQVSLTAGVTGVLPVANGGTGATTLTGYVKGNGTGAFTAAATIPNTDITGLGTMSTQNASAVAITGGTINATTIGATTASTAAFTTATATTSMTIAGNTVATLNNIMGRNRIINGNMYVAQRSVSAAVTVTAGTAVPTASTGYPCVDRFFVYSTGANVTAAQVAGSGNNRNLLQVTGAASVTAVGIGQRIETANSIDMAGQTCTLSVSIANSLLTTVTWTASYATTGDTFGTIGTPTKTQIATGTFTVTSTLTQYTASFSVPSAATTGIEILFTVGAQTSGTWQIGNVQFETGAVATPFERLSFGTQLALCQRYYYKTFRQGIAPAQNTNAYNGAITYVAVLAGANFMSVPVYFPVVMKSTPTIVFYNPAAANANWRNGSTTADSGPAIIASSSVSQSGFVAINNPQVVGDGVNNTIYVHATAEAEM